MFLIICNWAIILRKEEKKHIKTNNTPVSIVLIETTISWLFFFSLLIIEERINSIFCRYTEFICFFSDTVTHNNCLDEFTNYIRENSVNFSTYEIDKAKFIWNLNRVLIDFYYSFDNNYDYCFMLFCTKAYITKILKSILL